MKVIGVVVVTLKAMTIIGEVNPRITVSMMRSIGMTVLVVISVVLAITLTN